MLKYKGVSGGECGSKVRTCFGNGLLFKHGAAGALEIVSIGLISTFPIIIHIHHAYRQGCGMINIYDSGPSKIDSLVKEYS